MLFVTLAVLFAAIATFTKLENVRAAIAIILVSLPISLVLSFIIRRTDSKVSSLSIAVLLTLGYLVPKVLFKSIRSQYIELALLWIAIEILAFLFFDRATNEKTHTFLISTFLQSMQPMPAVLHLFQRRFAEFYSDKVIPLQPCRLF
jgi:ABC-type iron transport system FetAB permease component